MIGVHLSLNVGHLDTNLSKFFQIFSDKILIVIAHNSCLGVM